MLNPSSFQKAIFDFIKNESTSGIINAVAGAGKTTTIVNAVKLIPSDKRVLMLAFNKSIAEELAERVKLSNVDCKTLHSVGFAAYRNYARNVTVDSSKTVNVILSFVKHYEIDPEKIPGFSSLGKILSLGKNTGIGIITPNDVESWVNLIDNHSVFQDQEDVNVVNLSKALIEMLNYSNKFMAKTIDFDDMIYLPLFYKCSFPKYDVVFVDEAQDVSETNRIMLKSLIKPGGRLIAVGDPHQAIYGFRGADADSMSKIQSEFSCKELPLSVSYRCSKAVVEDARKNVSHILPSDTASEGSVSRLSEYQNSDFNKSDAIVCRNIAPLVKMAFSLISNGVPANVLGRDIAVGLVSMIKNLGKFSDYASFEEKLNNWKDKSIAKLKDKEDAIAAVNDKAECLRIFADNCDILNTKNLIANVEKFFGDTTKNCITLCTVHKSKGLEWDRVFILDEDRFFPKWAKLAWMKKQENNLVYVAKTRAKKDLVYIASDSWK